MLRGECSPIDDEQQIHCLLFGCHITDSVGHLACMSVKIRGADNLLCTVTTLGIVTIRWHDVVGVSGGSFMDDGGG